MTRISKLIKQYLLPVIAVRPLQPVYTLIHRAALIGMNIGPVGEVATSGEAKLLKKIVRRLGEGALVVDVGANVGEFTLACIAAATSGIRIVAFEPSARIRFVFSENLRQANASNRVSLVPKGLSSRPGTASLNFVSGFEGNSSLHARPHAHLASLTSEETIELTTLDQYCQEAGITHIDLLKVDIEGEELACLLGAKKIIEAKGIDYIQFEFGGCNISSGVFFHHFWMLLTPSYKIYRVLQNSLCELTQYNELLEIFTTTNFLAVRNGLSAPR